MSKPQTARDMIAHALVKAQCCDGCVPGPTHYTDADAVIRALDTRGWLIDPDYDNRRREARR